MVKLSLKINERVRRGGGSAAWANYLIKIGEDKIEKDENDLIALPDEILSQATDVQTFVKEIFPELGMLAQAHMDFRSNKEKIFKKIQNFCLLSINHKLRKID